MSDAQVSVPGLLAAYAVISFEQDEDPAVIERALLDRWRTLASPTDAFHAAALALIRVPESRTDELSQLVAQLRARELLERLAA